MKKIQDKRLRPYNPVQRLKEKLAARPRVKKFVARARPYIKDYVRVAKGHLRAPVKRLTKRVNKYLN